MRTPRPALGCIAALAIAACPTVGVCAPAGVMLPTAKMAGSLAAAARACGFGPADAVEQSRARGHARFAKEGIDAATFDHAFDAGVKEAQAKYAAATPKEKARGCEQIKAMGSPEMQTQLQQMRDGKAQQARPPKD